MGDVGGGAPAHLHKPEQKKEEKQQDLQLLRSSPPSCCPGPSKCFDTQSGLLFFFFVGGQDVQRVGALCTSLDFFPSAILSQNLRCKV